jgi:hypothetical protein
MAWAYFTGCTYMLAGVAVFVGVVSWALTVSARVIADSYRVNANAD